VVGETVDVELGAVVVGWGLEPDPDGRPPEQPPRTRAAARMTSTGGPTRSPTTRIFMEGRYL
jgi:hypothetical protein